ncbi:hypothetical protein DACRYDRAFT_77042 [Dacryopinax primogenitus]|uniref:C2H2-type domain-containing protein n=1 Tax=Dacryopinax primogenitus (strain DJM 731) TaxID=1858805 RepID=M5GEN9_DACPD|nr:uncharacterized protein DACRYDRAFT_77042 [Dacryopinax primogenitus]EJU03438.1 hypothetical protein DACRYDRAFT_77042 [Dacryopinax primogenitus]
MQANDTPDLGLSRLRVQGGGVSTPARASFVLVNGALVQNEKKKKAKNYACTWPGCAKAYTKPIRLEEHERSHTGHRPYHCEECGQSYMRDTHFSAHLRSHRPDLEKPYVCTEESCDKHFWTSSQLKAHAATHRGEMPFACDQCEDRFAKNAQLRRHVAVKHCPPGTKVFRCIHEGCTKSFAHSAKLRAHERKHDTERYVCSHPSCSSLDRFPTWTALRRHVQEAHPPTCPYKMCRGKMFSRKDNLRAHMKMHEEGHALDESGEESDESDEGRRKRRKNGGEWKCGEDGCTKSFRAQAALNKHKQISHLGLRRFACNVPKCEYTCGYKHVLQKHIQRHHAPVSAANDVDPEHRERIKVEQEDILLSADNRFIPVPNVCAQEPSPEDIISLLTGAPRHVQPARRILPCPFPDLLEQPFDTERRGTCVWTCSRVYDLWRHLRREHGFDCERSVLETWVKEGEERAV